jgi:FixJ family two-component response regulator
MPRPGRVFIVDDDQLHLLIIDGILRAAGYATEVFDRPEALLARLSAEDRGCVVMDLQMPGLNGLALQKALAERGAHLPILFVSGRADIADAVAAMKQGALDFLKKPVAPDVLRAMIAEAFNKDAAATAVRSIRSRAWERWATLSERERDVCRLFAKGLVTKQIAAQLGIHDSTAHAYRVRGMQKLAVGTIVELVELLRATGEEPGPGS